MAEKEKRILPTIEEEPIKKIKLIVLGIGGGGSSIISEIASRSIKNVDFVAVNTDKQALRMMSKRVKRFLIGQNLTFGSGTGMNPELGQEAALNEKEKIKKLLKDYDLSLIVSALGGGVGSGASPVFAKIAKSLNLISLGVFTLPFKFEGEKKMEIAKNSLETLRSYLNAFSFLSNERIFQLIEKSTPLKTALSVINRNLTESLLGLIETIYQPGLINIDFADLKTILEKRGKLIYLNTIETERKNDLKEIIKKLISNPLYSYSINGAKSVLLNIAGEKNLNLQEVSEISKSIFQLVNKEAKIIFGISPSKKYKNKIKITLLATGCLTKDISFKKPFPQEKEKKKQIQKKISSPQLKQAKKETKKKVKKIPEITPPKKEIGENLMTNNLSIKIVRKNALEIKKEIEEREKELLKQEEIWEKPAFLRLRFLRRFSHQSSQEEKKG